MPFIETPNGFIRNLIEYDKCNTGITPIIDNEKYIYNLGNVDAFSNEDKKTPMATNVMFICDSNKVDGKKVKESLKNGFMIDKNNKSIIYYIKENKSLGTTKVYRYDLDGIIPTASILIESSGANDISLKCVTAGIFCQTDNYLYVFGADNNNTVPSSLQLLYKIDKAGFSVTESIVLNPPGDVNRVSCWSNLYDDSSCNISIIFGLNKFTIIIINKECDVVYNKIYPCDIDGANLPEVNSFVVDNKVCFYTFPTVGKKNVQLHEVNISKEDVVVTTTDCTITGATRDYLSDYSQKNFITIKESVVYITTVALQYKTNANLTSLESVIQTYKSNIDNLSEITLIDKKGNADDLKPLNSFKVFEESFIVVYENKYELYSFNKYEDKFIMTASHYFHDVKINYVAMTENSRIFVFTNDDKFIEVMTDGEVMIKARFENYIYKSSTLPIDSKLVIETYNSYGDEISEGVDINLKLSGKVEFYDGTKEIDIKISNTVTKIPVRITGRGQIDSAIKVKYN